LRKGHLVGSANERKQAPRWTILTCEYPPGCGGVGDYTAQVAGALADAGDTVTVVCPPGRGAPSSSTDPPVEVMVLDDVYGRGGRQAIDARLDRPDATDTSTILVQYVPTGFGLRGANVPFCRWLLSRARRRQHDVRVMFHEPYFEYTWTPIRQNALAAAERVMARTLLRAASHVYLSTDAWRPYLAPYLSAGRGDFETLPIPSAIPRCDDASAIAARRGQLLGTSTRLVGHFGTFGGHVAPMIGKPLVSLLDRRSDLSAVCTGAGSERFVQRLLDGHPRLRGRLHGTGRVTPADAALTLAACDVLVQPYPDGVTTRRTSTMAGLINGRPVVTTAGHLTEPIWAASGAVVLHQVGDAGALVETTLALLDADGERAALAERGARLYRERFALAYTIRALRRVTEDAAA
jgi:glycosyltransferase involved in cell wall biosynthesis